MGQLHYKGYTGSVDYSEEDRCFFGKVIGLHDSCITFEGDSVDSLTKDFQDGIEDYLAYCKEEGFEPEKPRSGKLIVRISPDMHSTAASCAAKQGISLNEFSSRAIAAAL